MRWIKNFNAAYQVVAALPMRTLLLALPVATAVALALATLAIDRGVTAKAREAVDNRGPDLIVAVGGGRLVPGQHTLTRTLTKEDVDALIAARIRGAGAIIPTGRENDVPVSRPGKSGTYKVFGVTADWDEVRDFPAQIGRFVEQEHIDTSARVCVIGQTVARELFGEKDPSGKLFGGQDPLGQEININQVPCEVVGVLVSRGASPAEGDRDARICIPFTTFHDRLYRRVHLGQIVVRVPDPTEKNLTYVAGEIRRVIRQEHGIPDGQPDDFVLRTPMSIFAESVLISKRVFYFLFALTTVFALLAAAVIGIVFQHAIRARRQEIGIRRALGAEPEDIQQQIFAEGLIVSLLGGVAGVLLGLAVTWGLATWRELLFVVDAVALLVPLCVLVLTCVAGVFPARAAAKLDPAEALRPTA